MNSGWKREHEGRGFDGPALLRLDGKKGVPIPRKTPSLHPSFGVFPFLHTPLG